MASSRQLGDGNSTNSAAESAAGVPGGYDDATYDKPRNYLDGIPSRQRRVLACAIETEVIPRLMMAHSISATRSLKAAKSKQLYRPSHVDAAALARIALESHDAVEAESFVVDLIQRGASVEQLYLDLLAPAARHMGDMWTADTADFMQVTEGLSRLQRLFRDLAPAFERERAQQEPIKGKVLLMPVPGEQHAFGLVMVEEFLRRAGLECRSNAPKTLRDVTSLVKDDAFDVVALGASCEIYLDSVASCVKAIKKASKGAITVLVGGDVFNRNPEFVTLVGADGTARDGRDAALQVKRIVSKGLLHAN